MIKLKNLVFEGDKMDRLGGRYGGEPEKAIADPGNREPALSAKNEAASTRGQTLADLGSTAVGKTARVTVGFTHNGVSVGEQSRGKVMSAPTRVGGRLMVKIKFDRSTVPRNSMFSRTLSVPASHMALAEAVADAKDDVTPEDSHEIEKDLGVTTNSPKMFETETISDINETEKGIAALGKMIEAKGVDNPFDSHDMSWAKTRNPGSPKTPVGEVQKKLMTVLHGLGYGDHQLADLVRNPEFRNVHFKRIQTAASALKKKKLVNYDGSSKVSLVETHNMFPFKVGSRVMYTPTYKRGKVIKVNSPGITAASPRQVSVDYNIQIDNGPLIRHVGGEHIELKEANQKALDTYKGWKIYALPNYTTPYYYPEQHSIKGRKVGGQTEHYTRVKKVHQLIDKWLKQMGKESLGEGESWGKNISDPSKIQVKKQQPKPISEAKKVPTSEWFYSVIYIKRLRDKGKRNEAEYASAFLNWIGRSDSRGQAKGVSEPQPKGMSAAAAQSIKQDIEKILQKSVHWIDPEEAERLMSKHQSPGEGPVIQKVPSRHGGESPIDRLRTARPSGWKYK